VPVANKKIFLSLRPSVGGIISGLFHRPRMLSCREICLYTVVCKEPCVLTHRDLQSLSDEELMTQVQSGLHDALAVIVDRYQRLVWSVARKIVRDEGEAEDVVQIVFLECFQKMGVF